MKKTILASLLIGILTACGGSVSGTAPVTPEPPPPKNVVNLNQVPDEVVSIVNLNVASLYSGTDILYFNLLGKGDINGDGYDDLVIGLFRHTTTPSYSGRLHDPSGEIKPIVLFYDADKDTYAINAQLQSVIRKNQHPRQVAIADFDGDGRNDVFIADHGYDDAPYGNQNSLLLNKASGFVDGTSLLPQFSDFSHGLVLADFDGNGKSDLLVLNNTVGDKTKCQQYPAFTECTYTPPKFSESYVLFNNGGSVLTRGKLDIPNDIINFNSSTFNGNTRLYVGYSSDFNQDGRADLVISNHRDIFILESQNSFGKFSSAQVFGPIPALANCKYTPTSAITSIDIDGDGTEEILASSTCDMYTAYFRAFKRNSSGIWEDKTSILIPDQTANTSIVNDGWCYKFEIADVNSDGKKDVICQSLRGGANGTGNNIFWSVNDGKLQSMNIILQNGTWTGFETMVKQRSGTAILGFSYKPEQPNLIIKRWKN